MPVFNTYLPEDYDGYVVNWGIAQDSNQVIYGVNLGIVLQFDGVSWNKIDIINARAYSIASDSKGKVYIGGSNEFGFLDDAKEDSVIGKSYFSLKELLTEKIEFGIIWRIFTHGEDVYFLSGEYIFRYRNQEIKVFKTENRFENFLFLNERVLVSITNEGLHYVDRERLEKHFLAQQFKDKSIVSWVKFDNKLLFCGTVCYTLKEGAIEEFRGEFSNILASNRAYDMILMDDQTILIATFGGGVIRINKKGELLNWITSEDGLANNTVIDLYKDHSGNIWISTYNGISKFNYGIPIRFFGKSSGLNEMVRSVEVVGESIVVTSSEGVLTNKNTSGSFGSLGSKDLSCTELISKKNNLLAVCSNNVFVVNEKVKKIPEMGNTVNVLFSDFEKGKVYGSNLTSISLMGLDNNYQAELLNSFPLKYDISTLAEDKQGNLWMGGSSEGLFRISRESWISGIDSIEKIQLKYNRNDKTIRVTKVNNDVKFLTSTGLYNYNYTEESFERETSFGSYLSDSTNQIFMIAKDLEDNLWFRSEYEFKGAIKKGDDYEHYEGYLNLLDIRQTNDLEIDRYGNLLIASEQGLVQFNTAERNGFEAPFYTSVKEVLVRNDSLINGGLNLEKDILKYKDNELRFTYAAASYDAPEKTEYRVKLSGFEDNWGRWTSEPFKDYTNIPEGDYSYIVQAKNVYGIVSESKPFSFTVLPPWYRTWWAYLMYLFSFSALAYTGYKIRVNQLLKVERMRTKIASDLHDEVSATLTGISYFAEAVKRDPEQSKKDHFISLITESAGDAKEKITDIVWSINPENDDWELFLSKCRRFASDLLESKNIEYTLKIIDHIPGNLTMEVRQHLWMIFKEMVTNAVRHSGATRLDVILDVEERVLKLIVQDNGDGFVIENAHLGNGILNIQKRAKMINAKLEHTSEKEFGTRWRMELNL